jgi:hypothetical protein
MRLHLGLGAALVLWTITVGIAQPLTMMEYGRPRLIQPRKLAEFQTHPCSRRASGIRYLDCAEKQFEAKVREIGRIENFKVFSIDYWMGAKKFHAARIVALGPSIDQLYEIANDENLPLGTLFPASIVGRQPQIILVRFDDGGNYHSVLESYFVITKSRQVVRLDFSPVFSAAETAIPDDMILYHPTTAFDVIGKKLTISTERRKVNVGRKAACCEGHVEVNFRIDDGQVTASKAQYFKQ